MDQIIERHHLMSSENEDLFARLQGLSARGKDVPAALRMAGGDNYDEVLAQLGLSSSELTPEARVIVQRLIDELAGVREQLAFTLARLSELERLANEDSLAPISNRRAFLRHLARTIGFVERYGTSSSLLYFDLNDLKSINDEHGHPAGDAALIHVAHMLRAYTRSSDVVGRLGGDEFGVLLTHADTDAARQKARMLSGVIAGTDVTWKGRAIKVSVACGVHCLVAGEDPGDALAAADRAMYEQKRAFATAELGRPVEAPPVRR